MSFFLSAALLVMGQGDKPAPPPLTEEQSMRLRELVRSTQSKAAELQTQLDERQRELAALYADYDLNERQAQRLQLEIVDLQRQMLANYHTMQTELRKIVGKERFEVLRQRLNRVVPPAGVKEPEPKK